MTFQQKGQVLIYRRQNQTLQIEPWGPDALRVRATEYPALTAEDWALMPPPASQALIRLLQQPDGQTTAVIRNGALKAVVNAFGVISFYKNDRLILREYYRNYAGTESRESCCLKVVAREFIPIVGGDYRLTVRFEGHAGEKIFGMGQYQSPALDRKGSILELAQRNSQVTIPFALSNLGYGFFWNNPAIGKVMLGQNYSEWVAEATRQMDYWITVGDSPAKILQNYTAVTGRPPVMPEHLLGLWQSRLRYRTQEEVLQVARRYHELQIPLSVIVIDFFHWTRQGDWQFDPVYWPDPRAMVDELHAMGIEVMVSVWPSVDRKSKNFEPMQEQGLLMRAERGAAQTYDYQGDCVSFDATHPQARQYIWEQCKKSYYDYGIDRFWLDNAEPDSAVYSFDNYRLYLGPQLEIGNLYPLMYAKSFYDGMKKENDRTVVSLVRSAWAGSERYGALVWSGDVPCTYESFRDQVAASINMGLAGIPWWTSDIGGFMGGNVHDPAFIRLLIRWFQFAVFTPVLRMHGDRDPHDIPPLAAGDWGGGFQPTGQPNELWSYGPEAFQIMKQYLDWRQSLRPYIAQLMQEAHETGAPLIRAMFYEFPEDPHCWELQDQYMFGSDYLVAPILYPEQNSRQVYLPRGRWESQTDGTCWSGAQALQVEAPLAVLPVFRRLDK
ncbi:MAG: glycoside hydrolase family 31 protein [Oscillospiraceae bacterium]|nr:glycoside hydrolase family 31 protein [Oscillospiraceae bacterium]MDD4368396.1 glycoside hydrolase family 31 protein [Oscillospiraceae bacterium]